MAPSCALETPSMVALCLFCRDLMPVHHLLHQRMVECTKDRFAAPEMVEAGGAGVKPVAGTVGTQQKSGQGAVGFFFGRGAREANDDVRFLRQLLHKFAQLCLLHGIDHCFQTTQRA